MKQMTFSDVEYSGRKRITRKEKFLNEMDAIIPWSSWVEMIAPFYPSGKRRRPPRGIEVMLRMYFLQVWFNLSDEAVEDAIYDMCVFQRFLGSNFPEEQVPDATTLLKFRHLLEEHDLCAAFFNDIKERLEEAGLMMRGGTIVDATIIAAPSSTKNKEGKRDPEMHQTKKGNQWHHGMKVHAGVDAGSGYVHTITGTAANVHDIVETANLLREDDAVCYGDSGYTGAEKRDEISGNEHFRDIEFRINLKPSRIKMPEDYAGIQWDRMIENRKELRSNNSVGFHPNCRLKHGFSKSKCIDYLCTVPKSSVRCKVEHPFLIVKRQFGYAKVVYRGIAKNMNRFFALFTSANLVQCIRAGRTADFLGA